MPSNDDTPAGECAHCAHVRHIRGARGSAFYLCQRGLGDPAFARYPRLPMRGCAGYAPIVAPAAPAEEG